MTTELDHIIIFARNPEQAAAKFGALGFAEGTANVHSGQGTACRRFFFHNAYIELLWVSDEAEVRSLAVRATHLWERWVGGAGVCPFGLALRPGNGQVGKAPFDCWEYRPPYLPPGMCIQMAANTGVLSEPLLLNLSFAQRPDGQAAAKRQPLTHLAGVREITRVEIAGPIVRPGSQALESVAAAGVLTLGTGTDYRLEIGFDAEEQGRSVDLRPDLPVLLSW